MLNKQRGLNAQLGIYTFFALIVSHALGLFFLVNDRQFAPTPESFNYNMKRMSALLDLLETSPEFLHRKALKTGNTVTSEYEISASPMVMEGATNKNSDLRYEKQRHFRERADAVVIQLVETPAQINRFLTLALHIQHEFASAFSKHSTPQNKRPERMPYAQISAPLNNGQWLNGTIFLRQPTLPIGPMFVQFLTAVLFVGLGTWLVLRKFSPSMENLTHSIRAFGNGDATNKIIETGPREVALANRAFNEMQDKVWASMNERTKVIAALSHDLRSPITRLKLRAELIEDGENSQKILEICDEMTVLAQSTLTFAGEEFSNEAIKIVDIQTLVMSVTGDFVDAGHDVVCEDMEVSNIRCRPIGLKRVIRNVVQNAVTYGSRARISVRRRPSGIAVEVDDDGPGIPIDDLQKVFSPFIRVPGEPQGTVKGNGLGLSIAQAIMRSHGGSVELVNRTEGGLRVVLHIPIIQTTTAKYDAKKPS